MRWSIICLIWLREMRDQAHDRRTMFMIAVLPLLLYPILGYGVLRFGMGFVNKTSVIGIQRVPGHGRNEFPSRPRPQPENSLAPRLALLALTPVQPFPENVVAASSLAMAKDWMPTYPPLFQLHESKAVAVARVRLLDLDNPKAGPFDAAIVDEDKVPLEQVALLSAVAGKIQFKLLDAKQAEEAIADKSIDLLIRADPAFYEQMQKGDAGKTGPQPIVKITSQSNPDRYRLARQRLDALLDFWKRELKNMRLAKHGLPPTFDEPFEADDTNVLTKMSGGPERILDLMVRIFPFMLVMWSLAGALYPAVDLCAGEKERGTMETLLISPAGREEIVVGKFLTIWVFSGGTALLNLLSMGLTTQLSRQLPFGSLPLESLVWCMVLLLPLSAFFSAICLAVGAYARSSKEGQYYLMPLFLVTMPLMFLTLAPGVELNPFYSLVPVTGAALLMQKLMTTSSLAQVPWLYFIPVLAPIVLYSYLALRWAIDQFHREEVLFREAERLDVRLWLRHLLHDKEKTPTTGQAFFLFALVLGLNWMSNGIGRQLPMPVHSAIRMLAFVAGPTLLFALLLTTKPLEGLRMCWPRLREIGLAALLSVLLLPPLAYLTREVLVTYPHVGQYLEDRQPLVHELTALLEGTQQANPTWLLLLLAMLTAVCEELLFRGFLLSGMLKHFRSRTSVLLVSFLFALYHMNVFLFVPVFFLGIVLGLLTLRSGSLLPAVIFHFLYKGALIVAALLFGEVRGNVPAIVMDLWLPFMSICLAVALVVLWRIYRSSYRPELVHKW